MKTIHINKAFTLHKDGEVTQFAKGSHNVEDDIAAHWFVKGHSDDGATDLVPDARDDRIVELEALIGARDDRIVELKALVAAYEMAATTAKPGKK